MTIETLGDLFKTLRTEKNLTQAFVAKASGVGKSTLSEIESGSKGTRSNTASKLLKTLLK